MKTHSFCASCLQTNLYRKYQQNPALTNTNLAFGFRTKNLDRAKLERALNHIISRHENLRSNFFEEDGVVWQQIHAKRQLTVEPFLDDDVRTFIRPFCLERDLLIRAAVQDDLVLLDFCHIITDGFSMAIFFRELNALYAEETLPFQPPRARDCLVPAAVLCANEPYWLHTLEKPFTPLALPADFARASLYGGKGASLIATIGAKTTAAVRERCKQLRITPFVFYLSAFCLFLAKTCRTDDVITGTNFSCRNSHNLRAIGLFTTIAPVRVSVPATVNRDDFLLQMHAQVRTMLKHQQSDMDSVLAKKGLHDHRDVFRTLFSYEDARMADIRLGGKSCDFVPVPTKDAAFDCTLCFFPFKTKSAILYIYRSDLFRAQTAARYVDDYADMIATMTTSPKIFLR